MGPKPSRRGEPPDISPGGATECSPRRQPWVEERAQDQAPEGRQNEPRRPRELFFRPSGAFVLAFPKPRARARGYILPPLRGFHCPHVQPRARARGYILPPLRGFSLAARATPCSRTGLHSAAAPRLGL